MLKEIALDLRRYDTPEKLGSIVFDTASLSIEASETNMPRVNPSHIVKRGENYVRAPGRDKRDVEEMFEKGDPSTDAALKIREMLLSDNENNTYVWISPSGPYPESRIQVGNKTRTPGGTEYMRRYDISTTLKPEMCLLYGQLLASMSEEEMNLPQTPDDLRPTIFKLKIPVGENPFEFLSKLIELPEKDRWTSILNGTADKNKSKAVKAAVIATKPVRLNPHVIYSAPREYGAWIETQMRREGYGMDPVRFGCGGSNINSNLTSGLRSFSFNTAIAPFPGFTETISWHHGTCRNCGSDTLVGPCSICKPCASKM